MKSLIKMSIIFICSIAYSKAMSMEYTGGIEKEKIAIATEPYLIISKVINDSNNTIRIEHKGNLIVELAPKTSKIIGEKINFTKQGKYFTSKIQIKNVNDSENRVNLNTDINTKKKTITYSITTYMTKLLSHSGGSNTLPLLGLIYTIEIDISNFPHPQERKIKVNVIPKLATVGLPQVETEKE